MTADDPGRPRGSGASGGGSVDEVSRGPESKACAVCGRVLDWIEGLGWLHTDVPDPERDDHPAVPVPVSEIEVRGRCDLCGGEPVEATLRTTSPVTVAAQLHSGELEELVGYDEGWATCAVCTRLVRRGRWPQLLERCVRAAAAAHDQPVTVQMTELTRMLHRALRENLAGPPEPIER